MTLLQSVIDKFLVLLMSFACCVVVILIGITCIDVIGRYFLNAPLMGSTELTEISLGVLVFTSIPIITYQQKHIVVDILDPFIPDKIKYLNNQLSYVLIMVGFLLIGGYLEKIIARTIRRNIVTEYLEIPQAYIMIFAQYMCYVTAGLMALLIVQNLLNLICKTLEK